MLKINNDIAKPNRNKIPPLDPQNTAPKKQERISIKIINLKILFVLLLLKYLLKLKIYNIRQLANMPLQDQIHEGRNLRYIMENPF